MACAALILGASTSMSAQSLGAVAKQSEAQRKLAKSSGKVYTNDSLKSAPAPSQPAPAAATPAADQPAAPEGKPKPDGAKDEAPWIAYERPSAAARPITVNTGAIEMEKRMSTEKKFCTATARTPSASGAAMP